MRGNVICGLSGAGGVTLGEDEYSNCGLGGAPSAVSLESKRFVCFYPSCSACVNKAVGPPWRREGSQAANISFWNVCCREADCCATQSIPIILYKHVTLDNLSFLFSFRTFITLPPLGLFFNLSAFDFISVTLKIN